MFMTSELIIESFQLVLIEWKRLSKYAKQIVSSRFLSQPMKIPALQLLIDLKIFGSASKFLTNPREFSLRTSLALRG